MANSEEKILILKMLESGKVTSEEALMLIEALENNSTNSETPISIDNKKPNFSDELSKMKDKISILKKDIKSTYNQKDFDNVIEEFSTKAENLGKTFATTTFSIADKMVEFISSFVDTTAFNIFGTFKSIEKNFEAIAIEGMDLNINGVNGHIILKKHFEDKVLIKSTIKVHQNESEEVLEFKEDEKNISIEILNNKNMSIAHEIYLPQIRFNSINIKTSNGRIYIEDAKADNFNISTRNCHIDLMGIDSQKLHVETKNARINLNYTIGKDMEIITSNSIIDANHIKLNSLNATTTNGRIIIEDVHSYNESSDLINLKLKTSNSGIKVNMNDMANTGYSVNAKTSNGNINLLIPDIKYNDINEEHRKNFIEAKSNFFENFSQKVCIEAETSNASIEIMK